MQEIFVLTFVADGSNAKQTFFVWLSLSVDKSIILNYNKEQNQVDLHLKPKMEPAAAPPSDQFFQSSLSRRDVATHVVILNVLATPPV